MIVGEPVYKEGKVIGKIISIKWLGKNVEMEIELYRDIPDLPKSQIVKCIWTLPEPYILPPNKELKDIFTNKTTEEDKVEKTDTIKTIKTMEDIKRVFVDVIITPEGKDNKCRLVDAISIEELKQVAVEWVKIWKSYLSTGIWTEIDNVKGVFIFDSTNIQNDSDNSLIGRISSFVQFFGITNKDLEENKKEKTRTEGEIKK